MKLFLLIFLFFIGIFAQFELLKDQAQPDSFTNSYGNFTLNSIRTYQFYAQLKIGTPGINCSIAFDTTQNQFWLSTIWGNYNSSASSSFNYSTNSSKIVSPAGYVTGMLGTEIIAITQLSISNLKQPMLFVNKAVNISNRFDGILGLANDKNYQNWLELAVSQRQLPDSQFAFDLRKQSTATYFYAGSASFSSVQLTWINTDQTYYWSIPIQSTTIDGLSQPQDYNAQSAVVNPGSSILVIGATAYSMLMSNNVFTTCKFDMQSEFYFCSCNLAYPSIAFSSTSMNFTVLASDYMIRLQGGYCLLGVQINGLTENYMTFGDSIMGNYFVAYDKTNNKIGFSAAQNQNSNSKGFLNK